MEVDRALAAAIEGLEDGVEYIVFLKGKHRYAGCFRIDKAEGFELRNYNPVFEFYDDIEIYPNRFEAGTREHAVAENTTVQKIEHIIKESYYQRQGREAKGMKESMDFWLLRTTNDGHHVREEISGARLSKMLVVLMKTSKTLTIVEERSSADRLLQEMMQGTGRLRIHRGDRHFSELSPEEKERYQIEDDYAVDPLEFEENVVEHHKD